MNKFQELVHQYPNEMKEHQNHQHSKEPMDCRNKSTMQDLFQQNYGEIEHFFQGIANTTHRRQLLPMSN